MDEGTKAILVVVVTLLVVLLINYGIIKGYAGKNNRKTSMFSKTLNSAKNPWKRETDQLDELARLVEQVTAKEPGASRSDEPNQ